MVDTGKKVCENTHTLEPMITIYNLHMPGVNKVIQQLHGL